MGDKVLLGHRIKDFIEFIIGCFLLCLSGVAFQVTVVCVSHKGGSSMEKLQSVVRYMILCSSIIYERELMLVEELCG